MRGRSFSQPRPASDEMKQIAEPRGSWSLANIRSIRWRWPMKLIRIRSGPSATPAAEKIALTGPPTSSRALSIDAGSRRSTEIALSTGYFTGAKSMTATSAPSSAACLAVAAPMPVAPPTTSTRLLSYRNCSIPVISPSPTFGYCICTLGNICLVQDRVDLTISPVAGASAVEVYYDPFDFDIDDNPHPCWKRLRDEAPLYHNEKYNFYALSRYEDVERELHNWHTYRSG